MPEGIWVALIGGFATVVAAVIGTYPQLKDGRHAGPGRGGRSQRRGVLVIVGAVVAGALLVALSNAFIRSHRDRGKPTIAFDSLVQRGLRRRKRYIIPAAVMMVRLDSVEVGSERRLVATVRTVYDVVPLEKHEAADTDFTESYHSMSIERLDYIPGSEPERVTEPGPGMRSWTVSIASPAGVAHVVVTGIREMYPRQVAEARHGHYFTDLSSNEDEFCYPNSEGDVIGELVLMIESPVLRLNVDPGAGGAGILAASGARIPVEAVVHQEQLGSIPYRVIVARFRDLANGADACVRGQW